jgi:Ca-activated chloride channel family protein
MKRVVLLVLLFVLAMVCACVMSIDFWRQRSRPAPDGMAAEVAYVDRAEFPDVTVYLSVLDGSGKPVPGLTESDFAIAEDGDGRNITGFIGSGSQPVTAVMLIDRSGSMTDEAKMEGAIAAALAFLEKLEDGRDSLGVIVFDDSFIVLGDLRTVDAGVRAELRSQIGVLAPEGGTAYYDAIYKATGMLKDVPGRKVVLALTDGIDNRSARTNLNKVIEYVEDNNVVVYTIGLGTDVEGPTLERIACESGGRYYGQPSGSQLAQLYADIAYDLQSECSLTYESPAPRLDGTTRQVTVEVKVPTGTALAVGSYAVGGTLTPSLNAWSCGGGFLLLIGLVGLLFVPGLYDRARGRGQVVESEADPEGVVEPGSPPSAVPSVAETCPACGEALRPGARFCKQCGRAVVAVPVVAATCTHCGKALRSGARFCAKCGRRV